MYKTFIRYGFVIYASINSTRSHQTWVRKIPFESGIKFNQYNRGEYFQHMANGCAHPVKKHLMFRPIDSVIYQKSCEWIYIFTIDDHIVKIGGTRVGLHGRMKSYLSGLCTRTGSTKVSSTNAIVYNTLDSYFQRGYPIELYAYSLPVVELPPMKILDNLGVRIRAQTYQAYETIFLEDFKRTYGAVPALNHNWDPSYDALFSKKVKEFD